MSTIKKVAVIVISIMLSFALSITGSFKVATILPLLIGAYLSYLINNKKDSVSKPIAVLWLILLLLPILGYGLVKIKAIQLLTIINISEVVVLLIIIGLSIKELIQNYKKTIASLIVTIIALLVFYYNGYISTTTNRIFLNLIPLAIIIFNTIYYLYPISLTARKHLSAISIIIAFLYTLGNYKYLSSVFDSVLLTSILSIISIITFSFLFFLIFILIERFENSFIIKKNSPSSFNRKYFAIGIVLMFICWLPYLLASWPGVMTADSLDEIYQISGVSTLTNHHPLLHSLIIAGCYYIGNELFHIPNVTVATYSILQMAFMSIVFNYVVGWLKKKGINKYLSIFLWVFFAFNPYIARYSITMWKDIPFACCTLLLTCKLLDVSLKKKLSNKDWFGLGISMFFFVAFKGNGFYVFIILIPFLIYYFRKQIKKTLIFVFIISIVVIGYQKVLVPSIVPETEFIENLAIPIQQVAYTIKNDGDVTEEEIALLNQIMDESKIAQNYDPHLVDPVKFMIRDAGKIDYLQKHKSEYFKLWIDIGLRNPQDYIVAYAEQTKGYYYHNVIYWVYSDSIIDNDVGFYQDPLLPSTIVKGLNTLTILFQKVWHKLFSIGLYIYVLLYLTITYKLKKVPILSMIPSLGIWLTLLIASPVHAEFRYFFPIMLSTMFLLIAYLGIIIPTNEKV